MPAPASRTALSKSVKLRASARRVAGADRFTRDEWGGGVRFASRHACRIACGVLSGVWCATRVVRSEGKRVALELVECEVDLAVGVEVGLVEAPVGEVVVMEVDFAERAKEGLVKVGGAAVRVA